MQCSVPASTLTIQVFPIWSQIAQFITESPKGILVVTKGWLKIIQETWQVNLLLRASLQKQFLCSDCFHRGLVLAAAVFAHGINMSLPWAAKKMATVFSNCISQLYLSAVLAQCRLFAHGINMSLRWGCHRCQDNGKNCQAGKSLPYNLSLKSDLIAMAN